MSDSAPTNLYFTDAGDAENGTESIYDPPEPYRAVTLVAAKSAAQARYLAWKADEWNLGDLREQTWKCTRLVLRDVGLPVGVLDVINDYWGYTCEKCWGRPCSCYPCDDAACLMRAGKAHFTSECPTW